MIQPDFTYYQKETLFDISFSLGHAWAGLTPDAKGRIIDAVGGSRGLAEQAMLWAEEFDTGFQAKMTVTPDCESYMEDVDGFFGEKWNEFIAGHVADRMTEGEKK